MNDDETASRELIRLMTGPWVARSVAAAVRLGVVDRMDGAPVDTPDLAAALGLDPARLGRLLRLLSAVGVVRRDARGYTLTATGERLRGGHPSGLRDLALLYDSGLFADAWERLPETLRTGRTGFDLAHGTDVFTLLEGRPEDAELYSAGMAAGARFVRDLPSVYDFGGARTVVDVGGGSGELLHTVLDRAPDTRGVLLERPTALAAARDRLAAHVAAGRCDLVEGDFLAAVPGGADVYVLSRVLHNWSDEDAGRILRHCREAMAPDGRVLVVERVLPDGDDPWLSLVFDVHMMVMTTGAERTERQYEELLRGSGLTTERILDLPLEMRVLVARPA
ncbi:methyltransferase [Nocardiopsis sp. EMB25]|uniref:methyltransferase n=1 Tax=Nocardiopsis TaxID=2013 RepID=UPI00034DC16B|nr:MULTISPECIES: methyltransferase [Nocardiopsis]MCY9784042.1 methyltransferase [Nocardiopsis sp. EMB25]